MLNVKRIALIAMAVVAVSASSALAGTKYAANLVSNDPGDPPANPTLSSKSSLKLSDKGVVTVALAGVTDGGGALVTTSTSYNDSLKDAVPGVILDPAGSEYVVILKIQLAAIAGSPLFITTVEVPIPVDLKAGKGKTKLDLGPLTVLLPSGAGRGLEIKGAEVWGPLGPAVAATCNVLVNAGIPASLIAGDPACRGGAQIGFSGIIVAPPAP